MSARVQMADLLISYGAAVDLHITAAMGYMDTAMPPGIRSPKESM